MSLTDILCRTERQETPEKLKEMKCLTPHSHYSGHLPSFRPPYMFSMQELRKSEGRVRLQTRYQSIFKLL